MEARTGKDSSHSFIHPFSKSLQAVFYLWPQPTQEKKETEGRLSLLVELRVASARPVDTARE